MIKEIIVSSKKRRRKRETFISLRNIKKNENRIAGSGE